MANQFPYGNAFIIGTPKSDRLVQQITQDQRQRELYEQQQARMLDQEFSKNVSDIRDVDIADAVKKYQEYKNIGQQLYKDGNRMSNTDRIAKQLDKQRAAQEYYSLIGKSKDIKEGEDLGYKSYSKDPNKHEETFPEYLRMSRMTPANQHPGVEDILRNSEQQTQDFTKNVAAAVGKQTKVGNSVANNGLTSTPTDYYAYNSPSQFATTLAGSIPDKRGQNKFINQHSYNDLAAQDLLQKYNTLSQTPEFKKAYPNEPPINTEVLNDPFQKAITLTSIDHILRHPPTAIIGKPYNNTGAVMDRQDATWLMHNAITDAEKRKAAALLSANKDRRLKDMQSYGVSDPYEQATKKPIKFSYPDGTEKELYDISDLSPTEKEDLLGKGTGNQQYQNYPVEIAGKQYLQKGKDGELLNDRGEPIDRDQPFINRVKRVGRVTKLQSKGELQKSASGKPLTLAERMKAARGQ